MESAFSPKETAMLGAPPFGRKTKRSPPGLTACVLRTSGGEGRCEVQVKDR
jgi:hypothetical protein